MIAGNTFQAYIHVHKVKGANILIYCNLHCRIDMVILYNNMIQIVKFYHILIA